MSYRVILAKLLHDRFANDFLDGSLYLNTCSHFASLDGADKVRADPHDGLLESRRVSEIAIQSEDGNWLPIAGVQNPVSFHSDAFSSLNLLCLYTITDRDGDSFDSRNAGFGEIAILITDLPTFISRVRAAAISQGWEIAHGPVQYVPRHTHDGYMGPFRKFEEFTYQNEFRFVFKTERGEPCRLHVGSLRDITSVTTSSNIPATWSALLKPDA